MLWAEQFVLTLFVIDAVGHIESVLSPIVIRETEPHGRIDISQSSWYDAYLCRLFEPRKGHVPQPVVTMKQSLLIVAEGDFLVFDDVRGVVRHLYCLELHRKWSWTQLSVLCCICGYVGPDAGFAGPWPVRAALVRRSSV